MRALAVSLALAVAPLGAACRERRAPPPIQKGPSANETRVLREALVTYADIAFAGYADAASGARGLRDEVGRFVRSPSQAGLDSVKRAWLLARHPYQQTEALRFYDGPIDRVELLVNTWPIDENYVESGAGLGKLGIVENDKAYPEISSALLEALNAKEGETSISTGYHVIEFLLWGRDTRADGPGDRSFEDYVSKDSPRAERRSKYLGVAIDLLVRHLDEVRDAWAPDRDNYRKRFLAMPPIMALGLAIKGMGALSGPELAGERLTVAYETKDQENEHSCFSDNTVSDLADDALGIENLCLGRYARSDGSFVKGAGLCDAVGARDAALGKELRERFRASVLAMQAIPSPFDQAMLGSDEAPGRKAIQTAIHSLERQTATLTKVAARFDLRLALEPASTPQPNR